MNKITRYIKSHPLDMTFMSILALYAIAHLLFGDSMTAMYVGGAAVANGAVVPSIDETLESLTGELGKMRSDFATGLVDLKAMKTDLETKSGAFDPGLKASVDELLAKVNGQGPKIEELEQKIAARMKFGDDAPDGGESWGQQLIKSDRFKEYAPDSRTSMRHQVKQVTSVQAGGLLRRNMQDGLVSLPRDGLIIRDLLTVIPTESASIDYAIQTLRDNNAATVGEGAKKPYSDYAWDVRTVPTRVIAHLVKLSRQARDDAPRIVAEIDSEMRYGLGVVEEAQLLYGNNTGQNLHGIMPQATAFSLTAGVIPDSAAITRIDIIRMAVLQVVLGSKLPATGIVLNPIDWAAVELTKDTSGGYLMSNPAGQLAKRLWNLPVVDSPAMALDDFLVGNFTLGATLYDRMAVELLLSTENVDDFENNLMTFRAEERIALAVKRALAFVKGKFSAHLRDQTALAAPTP
jgi:HK97 family phage major capsid protein